MIGTIKCVNRFQKKQHPKAIRKSILRSNSPVGNPYQIIPDTKYDRDYVVSLYKGDVQEWIKSGKWWMPSSCKCWSLASEIWMRDRVNELLAGNDIELACYCKPKKCHGDVLVEAIVYMAEKTESHDGPMSFKEWWNRSGEDYRKTKIKSSGEWIEEMENAG